MIRNKWHELSEKSQTVARKDSKAENMYSYDASSSRFPLWCDRLRASAARRAAWPAAAVAAAVNPARADVATRSV